MRYQRPIDDVVEGIERGTSKPSAAELRNMARWIKENQADRVRLKAKLDEATGEIATVDGYSELQALNRWVKDPKDYLGGSAHFASLANKIRRIDKLVELLSGVQRRTNMLHGSVVGPVNKIDAFSELNALISDILQASYNNGFEDGSSFVRRLATGNVSIGDVDRLTGE